MPGYSQLKKLSEQVLKLGNEIKVRSSRGEKAFPFPIPAEVPDIDDSEEFLTGMPEKPLPPEEEIPEEEETVEEEAPDSGDIGLDALLGEMSGDGEPDLSAFDTAPKEKKSKKKPEPKKEEPPPPPPKPKGINGTGYSGFGFDEDGNLEDTSAESNKPDIAAMMGGPGKKSTALEGTGIPELDAILNQKPAEGEPAIPDIPNIPEIPDVPENPDVPNASVIPDIPGLSEEPSVSETIDVPETSVEEAAATESAPPIFDSLDELELPSLDELPEIEEIGIGDDGEDFSVFDQNLAASETALDNSFRNIFSETASPAQTVQEEPPAPEPEAEFAEIPSDEFLDIPSEEYVPPQEEKKPEEKKPEAAAASSDSVFDFDGIEIEDYSPAEGTAKKTDDEFNIDAVFSDEGGEQEVSKDELPQKEEKKEKTAAKLLSIEDDLAILKPDIFTENPVTRENPPYYVTGPFGKLPSAPQEQPLEESYEPPKDDSGGFKYKEEEPVQDTDVGFEVEDVTDQGAASTDDAFPSLDDEFPPIEDMDMGGVIDMGEDLPEGINDEMPAAASEEPSAFDGFNVEEYQAQEGGDNVFDSNIMDEPVSAEPPASGGDDPFASATEFEPSGIEENSPFAMDMDSFNMDSFGGGEGGEISADAFNMDSVGEVPEFGALGENVDLSSGGSLDDFTIPDTDSQLDKAKNDFDLDSDDFSIPGFSEDGADPYGKNKKPGLDQIDFTGAVTGDGKTRNSLTEEEYKKFKKNLSGYPLNVRIAVEDMIVQNEFTDEVIFELIDKILKKVTARQLAGYLEKMLDIPLHVPRDFEKRTAEEYEAYKASFSYQLKARILPVVLIGMLAAMLLVCIGYLGHRFIYKPLKAESLYKEGYTLLESDNYPQSEMKFDEALTYKSKKKWFFKYARGYRAHRQYDRAELFYKNILKRFYHDKQGGLEYAQMLVEDLAEYEKAEEILKREVLDYHANDPDGILALGDTYLDWGTEKDPEKLHDAYEQYSLLTQLYGNKNADLYQSRFLRYYIRTDQLRNVLELKEFFYPREKSLSAADWTELSGYLMDNLYGELPRDREYLRGKIEDLRDMMLFAIKADPTNPVASYNLSRYLVEAGDHTKAMNSLKSTEKLFDNAANIKKRDVYKQINTYRLLGEEYLYDREYILARETFTNGIELFEKRERQSNFEGDKNIGALYYDMGNLEYFISGDLDSANRNYKKAVANKHDTPSVRYRIGYIDYSNEDYASALNNFLKASEEGATDSHTLLALGNTLSLRGDNYVAQGYYSRLLNYLDFQREKYGIVVPQIDPNAGDMVETYMKAANNLGVAQFRVSRQSGDSSMNAKALVNFQNSIRYYDALTRNQETMVRVPGSNLAVENMRYASHPISTYEPAIYTEIPRVLDGEKGLEQ